MRLIDRCFSNTPWWLISAGIHAVLILGAGLVAIERMVEIEVMASPIVVRPPGDPQLPEEPRIRDVTGQHRTPLDIDQPVTEELFAIDPTAKIDRTLESEDNDLAHERKGDSWDALGYIPGERPGGINSRGTGAPGVTETLGLGPGGGYSQRLGGPRGGTRNTTPRIGSINEWTPQTESAVLAALRWLARHQNPDGGWSAQGYSRNCAASKCSGGGEADYDTGVTGLSVLAFLGAGYTSMSKDDEHMIDPAFPARQLHFGEAVKKALQWLIAQQDPDGCVGERGMKHLYNHAIAALALSEGYGMSGLEVLRGPAQKSIDFLVAAQNPGKGWRYSAKSGDNDTSVTGWAVMALKSAELSGLAVPPSAFVGALAWLAEATEKNGYYRVGYTQAGTGKVFVPGKNEQFADHPSMSAVAVLSRIFIQKTQKEPALTAVNFLGGDLPSWKPGEVDFYYWYYASLALFQFDGPKGAFWSKWNEPMKSAIVPHQKLASHGCENGSWDPSEDRWGFEGGRVYAVAINCLMLEVYYRYAHVFGGSAK
ncbi:MAG TPA: prenyltransferase/squalene oxidase repeat-containing protein [Planctomycetota bacterium]|nr:prenyltransferase/squalene oxidase repeat-containing protein [Planctomycetota bacterium]